MRNNSWNWNLATMAGEIQPSANHTLWDVMDLSEYSAVPKYLRTAL